MKKLICLALTLVMLCVAVGALAAGSKTVTNLNKGTATQSTYVEEVAEVVAYVDIAAANATQKAAIEDAIAKIGTLAAPVDFFNDAVKGEIANLFPGVDLSALALNELAPFSISNYDASFGSTTVKLSFPTKYSVGQRIAVLVGIVDANGNTSWRTFAGVVQPDGSVSVVLPPDLLLLVQGGNAVVGVLSE